MKIRKNKDNFQNLAIYEVGILIRGTPIVSRKFYENHEEDLEFILRSGLFTALLHCIEEAIAPIEYIEGNKYLFIFHRGKIESSDLIDEEPIIAYTILDKQDKKVEKMINKILKPLLELVLNQFIKENTGKEFSEITQFEYYKKIIDDIFSTIFTI